MRTERKERMWCGQRGLGALHGIVLNVGEEDFLSLLRAEEDSK